MNTQRPEPQAKAQDGSILDLHSIFYTIQGEGPFSGCPAVFVRLAGCNLQCPGCDTEYTEGRELVHIDNIRESVEALAPIPGTLVVITGGEPLRQCIGPLCLQLNTWGFPVQIESNGVFEPDGVLTQLLLDNGIAVTLVVSPKTSRINAMSASFARAFKYVLDHRSVSEDGLPIKALEHPASTGVARPPEGFVGEIYVNPYDAKNDADNALNLTAVTESCMTHGYRLGIQLHKLIKVD